MTLAAYEQTEVPRLKVMRKACTLLSDLGNGADDNAGQSVSQTTSTSDLRRFVGASEDRTADVPGRTAHPPNHHCLSRQHSWHELEAYRRGGGLGIVVCPSDKATTGHGERADV
jgi:hypothetical protein